VSPRGDFVWYGEKNRQLDVYRPCPCGTCSKNGNGVGYLSFSDATGKGLTVWIGEEEVFRSLRNALKRLKRHQAEPR